MSLGTPYIRLRHAAETELPQSTPADANAVDVGAAAPSPALAAARRARAARTLLIGGTSPTGPTRSMYGATAAGSEYPPSLSRKIVCNSPGDDPSGRYSLK